MFNHLPGQGLGFSGSSEIAFGLDPISITVITTFSGVSSGNRWKDLRPYTPESNRKILKPTIRTNEIRVVENNYTVNKQLNDDEDMFQLLHIIFDVIKD